jgi:N-acetylglucosamine-6-phosphate deacetylase
LWPNLNKHDEHAMMTLHGNILTPTGFVQGALALDAQGRIANITGAPVATATVRDNGAPIVLPGFIDLHVHGGAGHDIMEGGDAALQVARLHARHGTTSLLATTMTAPQEDLDAAFAAMGPLCRERAPNAARVLGVHLEGPYISEARLGAQPPFARPASFDEIHRLHAMAPIRLITLAPEVGGNDALIAQLVAEGFKVQLGHTTGSYEQGVAALRCGATGFTHLFNAMSALHHREPGMVGAALAHAEFAEVIPDLLHVHPGAIHAALRAIPKLYCVTASTSAAGMPDGDYKLGRHTVTKCMGGVRLADASRRVSTYAADHMGLQDRGRLQAGAWGDVVVLDRDLALQAVYVEGAGVLLN